MAIGWSDLNGHGAQPSRAARVLVGVGAAPEQYMNVNVLVDGETGQLHLISADGERHLVSAPIAATLVEWGDVAELRGV
ncbi:MAG: hypothetical protein JWM27_1274 [Gemmatimonadetes bacterium]|nr:hypothetical protein [Gemmatimonadota bacterium]